MNDIEFHTYYNFLLHKRRKEIEVTPVTPSHPRGILANLNLNQILFDSTLHLHTHVLLMYVTTEVAMYIAADAVFPAGNDV